MTRNEFLDEIRILDEAGVPQSGRVRKMTWNDFRELYASIGLDVGKKISRLTVVPSCYGVRLEVSE